MVAEVVAGAVVTVASEGDMVGVIVLHQLLLRFKTNPNSHRLVGSETHLLPESTSLLSTSSPVYLQITVPLLIRHNGVGCLFPAVSVDFVYQSCM
jgi:hypothetical protein